jgi:hypothetical protein
MTDTATAILGFLFVRYRNDDAVREALNADSLIAGSKASGDGEQN